MNSNIKKVISVLLAVTIIFTGFIPGLRGVNNIDAKAGSYEIMICDSNGNEITDQLKVMESDQVQLSYKLVDCSMPEGAKVVWSSDTPLTASVSQDGLVRGHDSSKGAAVRLWIDNDVKPIVIVGPLLASTLEKIMFNDSVDLDTMDTEAIANLVAESIGTLASGTVATQLIEKLKERLNNIDSKIYAKLVSSDGDVLATDYVHVLVTNSDKWYAAVIPNGAFITNKDTLPTTVAVGGKLKLVGGVTPLRLGYGVTWSLEADSILKRGTDYAELSDDGTITFKKVGTVKVTVSPNADQIVDKLLSYVQKIVEIGDNVDTGEISDILVKVLGLDIPSSTMKTILDIIVTVAGLGTNYASLITKAVKLLSNYLLKASINDSITFTIVDSLQLESFEIAGNTEVSEGETSQLSLTNIVPQGANSTNILWTVADESVAYVDENGILIGRDAGGISALNKRTTTVTAFVDGVSATIEVTVKGKLITTPVDIDIEGPSVLEIGATGQYSSTLYPSRSRASVTWGIVNDEGEITYCKSGGSVSNSFATMNSNGVLTAEAGGTIEIVAKAGTLPSCVRKYTVYIGTLAKGIEIDQGEYLSVKVPLYTLYNRANANLSVSFNPPNASNQNIKWSVLSGDLEVSPTGVVNPSGINAAYGVIQATSYDGGYTDTIVVSFANYPVTGVSLNTTSSSLIVGDTVKLKPTVEPVGTGVEGAKIGDASIKDCQWISSDENIATVKDGVVTGVDSGTAEITCKTWDGGYTATCTVTVTPNKSGLQYAIDLYNSGKITEQDCTPDDWKELQDAYQHAVEVMAMESPYQATVNDASQAIIDIFDRVGAYVHLYGINITKNGSTAPMYNSVKVSTSKRYDNDDNAITFGYELVPSDAMGSSVSWSSSNSSVSCVNGKCKPTENKACWSVITVSAVDFLGNKSSSSVFVSFANYPVDGIKLDKTSIPDAKIYNTGKLNATVSPEGVGVSGAKIGGAWIEDVTWASRSEDVVEVDNSGNISYVGLGNATVTVTTVDGGYSASCDITVNINKTALENQISTVDNAALNSEDYTNDSFAVLTDAYNIAVQVRDNAESTQAEIDAAASTLKSAYESLKRFIKVEGVKIMHDGEDANEFVSQTVSLVTAYNKSSIELDSRVLPLDSQVSSITWSSNTDDISVDDTGKCTPTRNSACYGKITVTVTDEKGNVATDTVNIAFANYTVTKVNLSKTNVEVSLDDEPITLTAECKHVATLTYNASVQKVFWASKDENVVTVDENGKLTYINAGQTTVTATSADGGIVGECIVTVCGDKSELRAAIKEADDAKINVQDHTVATSTAYTNAYNHAVEVEASVLYSQEEINKAAQDLRDAMNNLEDYIHMDRLTVYYNGSEAPEFISIKVPTYKTYTSQSVTLSYDFAPANCMYESIVWASSDSLVSVDNGVVKPAKNKACGAAITLTATDHYGNKIVKTTYVSFANYPVTGISIDKTDINVNYGAENQTITATLTDDNALGGPSVEKVVWRSTDEDVATVNDGVVTFVEAGSCQIIASSLNGGFSATCNVTVTSDPTALREVYSMVVGLNLKEEEYTEKSWAVFADAFAKSKEILDNPNPKQRDIDSYAIILRDAYENLDKYVKIKKVYITNEGSDAADFISKKVALTSKYTDQSISLGYRIDPSNATYNKIEWFSSNGSVSVSQSGECKPTENKACWSCITLVVTDKKGEEHKDTAYVSFANTQVTGISVKPTAINDAVNGGQSVISYEILPKATAGIGAANIQDVAWFTSDEKIATVENGVVSYHNSGTVIITARSCDGGYSANVTIKVFANKSDLASVIANANKLEEKKYTPASWTEFKSVLETANSVNNAADPTQAEVDTARENLTKAISNLVEYVYVSELGIVANGQQSDFINVKVNENEPYVTAYTNISAVVNPSNAMYKSLEWSFDGDISGNSISQVVAPKKNLACYGTATLKITDDFDNVYTKTVYISFTKNPTTGVKLDKTSMNLPVSTVPFTLSATVMGENGLRADISDVIWKSSDDTVATVDQNGNVNIVSGGYVEISVTTVIGGFTDVCKIFVTTDKSALKDIIEKVVDADYKKTDYIESTYKTFETAYNEAISVYSNNEASQNEIDTAVSNLDAAVKGLQKYVHIESIVIKYDGNNAPDFISINVPITKRYNAMSAQLSYQINPSNAMFESVTWSCDNSVIPVDSNGKVAPTTNKPGVTKVTLTAVDYYGVEYEKSVYVAFANTNVTGISISNSEISGFTGGTAQLSATVSPTANKIGIGAASVQDVLWVSSDESVATVNQSGKVTYVDGGTCTITVYSKDGGKSASCKVTVTATQEKVALSEKIAEAKSYNEKLYTAESYKILADAIVSAQSVYNKATANNTEINGAIQLLDEAVKTLVFTNADYTSVKAAIEVFEETDKFFYTQESIDAVQKLIDEIDYTLKADKQSKVEEMAAAINNAVASLVPTKETKVDTKPEEENTVVDSELKMIYGLEEGVKDVDDYIRVINGKAECQETENGFGTGSTVIIRNENDEIVDSYKVVIFGDVNGDGVVDGNDSSIINFYMIFGYTFDDEYALAADVNKDGKIDEDDALLVENAGIQLQKVSQK